MIQRVVFAIVILLIITVGVIVFTRNKGTQNLRVVPTTQPSPTAATQNAGLKTYVDNDQNVSFQYPESLQAKYIRAQKWPPDIAISSDSFSCKESGQIQGQLLVVRKKMGNTTYCIENTTEGAAGTLYSNYTYSFIKKSKLVKLQFTIAYPQCGNYPDPQKTECEGERQTFDLDALIDRIAQSVKQI